MTQIEPRVVALDGAALDELDEALVLESSRLAEHPQIVRGAGLGADDLSAIRADIIDAYKAGVSISPQTESRPLIPLYAAEKIALPATIRVDYEELHYDFYLVQVVFATDFPSDVYPLTSELALKLDDDVTDTARRTIPTSLFPARRDISLFKADLEVDVNLDASLGFTVPLPDQLGQVKAGATVKASLGIGPFHFFVRRAVVEVKGSGSRDILWRYRFDDQVAGANDFRSFLVLRVAQEARRVEMAATIAMVPCKPRWIFFKRVLPQISHQLLLPVELT
jgi:hypothetical protein